MIWQVNIQNLITHLKLWVAVAGQGGEILNKWLDDIYKIKPEKLYIISCEGRG